MEAEAEIYLLSHLDYNIRIAASDISYSKINTPDDMNSEKPQQIFHWKCVKFLFHKLGVWSKNPKQGKNQILRNVGFDFRPKTEKGRRKKAKIENEDEDDDDDDFLRPLTFLDALFIKYNTEEGKQEFQLQWHSSNCWNWNIKY